MESMRVWRGKWGYDKDTLQERKKEKEKQMKTLGYTINYTMKSRSSYKTTSPNQNRKSVGLMKINEKDCKQLKE